MLNDTNKYVKLIANVTRVLFSKHSNWPVLPNGALCHEGAASEFQLEIVQTVTGKMYTIDDPCWEFPFQNHSMLESPTKLG